MRHADGVSHRARHALRNRQTEVQHRVGHNAHPTAQVDRRCRHRIKRSFAQNHDRLDACHSPVERVHHHDARVEGHRQRARHHRRNRVCVLSHKGHNLRQTTQHLLKAIAFINSFADRNGHVVHVRRQTRQRVGCVLVGRSIGLHRRCHTRSSHRQSRRSTRRRAHGHAHLVAATSRLV